MSRPDWTNYYATVGYLILHGDNPWDYMPLAEAIEHCAVAQNLIDLFDLAEGRVLILKPESVRLTEGFVSHEI